MENTNEMFQFDVKYPKSYIVIVLILDVVCAVLLARNLNNPTPELLTISKIMAVVVLVPSVIILYMLMIFKISVKGNFIYVRNAFGRSYHFNKSEALRVVIKSGGGRSSMESLVFYAPGGKFTVNGMMPGFDRLMSYVTLNISQFKIERSK